MNNHGDYLRVFLIFKSARITVTTNCSALLSAVTTKADYYRWKKNRVSCFWPVQIPGFKGEHVTVRTASNVRYLADFECSHFIPSTYPIELRIWQIHSQYQSNQWLIRPIFLVPPSLTFKGESTRVAHETAFFNLSKTVFLKF